MTPFTDYDVHPTFTKQTELVYGLIQAVDCTTGISRLFHTVLEDWNLDFERFSTEPMWEEKDGAPPCTSLEQMLNDALKAASIAERVTALAAHEGYIEMENPTNG